MNSISIDSVELRFAYKGTPSFLDPHVPSKNHNHKHLLKPERRLIDNFWKDSHVELRRGHCFCYGHIDIHLWKWEYKNATVKPIPTSDVDSHLNVMKSRTCDTNHNTVGIEVCSFTVKSLHASIRNEHLLVDKKRCCAYNLTEKQKSEALHKKCL